VTYIVSGNENGARHGRCYHRPLLGSDLWPVGSCHFMWPPWMTFNVIHLLRLLFNPYHSGVRDLGYRMQCPQL